MRISRWLLVGFGCVSGCAHYLKLDPKNVTSLELAAVDDRGVTKICARGGLIDVVAVTKDGKKAHEGSSQVVSEKEFDPKLVELTTDLGSIHERSWNPPDLAMAPVDKTIHVTARLVANPSVTQTIELEPHWGCQPEVALVGGGDGEPGPGGGQADDEAPGGDGGNGGRGGNGYRSVVSVGWLPRAKGDPLVMVLVQTDGLDDKLYLMERSLTLRVWGGGGGGGPGGQGVMGGNGGTGHRSGNGGRGGDGGDGGDGGEITVQYDAQSPELAKRVAAEVPAGPGGNGGAGGYSGNADNDNLLGQNGPEGRAGRDGRPGPQPRYLPMAGLSQRLAASQGAAGGERVAMERPAPPPTPAPPPRGKPGKRNQPPAAPEPAPPPSRPPPQLSRDDGARMYVGQASTSVTLPRQKPRTATQRTEVVSTRTRKHHFTVDFGSGCKIAFHRPPNEKQHVYDNDMPVTCNAEGFEITIKTARLELPSEDAMKVVWDGSLAMKRGAQRTPVSDKVHFTYDAKRR